MVTLSELQTKEVVVMQNGKRLGFIEDLEIDEQEGLITAIIIADRQAKGAFFNKPEETMILWKQIVTIGEDIILVTEENAGIRTGNDLI